ncbi:MAG: GntR family transcriptional regulator [Tannerella sp.]|jgi:DNA-binding transcriptional regulator YhcF (GntR family)/predicted transcriptional regulator|nr:GntR family transcriptional regulator [Tannerella sp.]
MGQHNKVRIPIVEDIKQSIYQGVWKTGEKLPSVNSFIKKYGVSRVTIFRVLQELKDSGIIISKDRVGYFVSNEQETGTKRVMLCLTAFDPYHEVLYKEIVNGVNPEKVSIDVFFHHCNPDVFRSVVKDHIGYYRLYVVIPFRHPAVRTVLKDIPRHRLLQIARPPVVSGTSYICQEFHDEVLAALMKVKYRIVHYNRFTMIFSEIIRYLDEIKSAFTTFCEQVGIDYSIENEINKDMIRRGTAFFTFSDNDLIKIIEWSESKGFKLGNEMGLISYNDTPMKKIIRNGVTVISPDFQQMGRAISRFIETRRPTETTIPTELILRNSL